MTVTIGAITYEVYGSLTDAETYLNASNSNAAGLFLTASATDKAKALVTTARLLNRQLWQGELASPSQPLAWPRSGVNVRGLAVPATMPQQILDGSYELAALILEDPTVAEQRDTSENISSLAAGSVNLSFFRYTSGSGRFPTIIQELLGPYLLGANPAGDAEAGLLGASSGTGEESQFDATDGYTVNL